MCCSDDWDTELVLTDDSVGQVYCEVRQSITFLPTTFLCDLCFHPSHIIHTEKPRSHEMTRYGTVRGMFPDLSADAQTDDDMEAELRVSWNLNRLD